MNRRDTLRTAAGHQAATLAAYLGMRRDGLGVARAVCAQRIGVGEETLRHWENGERQPDMVDLIAWMLALGLNAVVSPSALDRAVKLAASALDGDWIERLGEDLASEIAHDAIYVTDATPA